MDWKRIEPWDYVVVNVASEYHKKYNMVELDDIKQSLYEWFVLHPRKLTEWESLGAKHAKNLLYRSLRNQALDYCQLWKSKSIGYETSDLFYYDPEVVEALLPAVLRGDIVAPSTLNFGMPGRPPAPSEGGNLMAMMAEIRAAFEKLNEEDKSILYLKHVQSLDYSKIAIELTIPSDDAARMRHNRAIKKLITRLGGFRPFKELPDEVTEDTVDNNVKYSSDNWEGNNNSEAN